MNKKISVFLSICILFIELTFPGAAVHADTFGIYTYEINNEEVTITYCDSSVSGSVEIPDRIVGYPVTAIGSSAFSGCSSITSVTIPDSVTSIGGYAFSGCTSLTSISIPDSVTSIGEYAFYDGSKLTDIYYAGSADRWLALTKYVYIPSTAMIHCGDDINITDSGNCGNNLRWLLDDKGTLIISGTGKMQDYYYSPWKSDSLKNVIINTGITSIGNDAFSGCSSLTSVTIPDSVTSIGNRAFHGCSSLTSVTIPDSVTSISDYAFYNCSSLTSVTIPDSVTSIGSSAFSGCYNLKEVHISDIAAWCNISFDNYNTNPLSNSADLYLNGELVKDLTIPDGVTSIGDYAFCNCSSIESVAMPNSVTYIGSSAFYGCYSLASVTIPDGITSIGRYAFYCCESLKTITIPDSVTSIGERAFSYCSSLASVTIPNSVTSIGERAFYGCSSLTSIAIPNSVTSIGSSAFEDCSGLKNIYYRGTEEEWSKIDLGWNVIPKTAAIHYMTYVTGVSLDIESLNLLKGNARKLTAAISPSDATNKNVTWSSSNENAASVENGLVTAVGAGTAIITVTTEDGGYTASCSVTVTDFAPESDFRFENGTITKYLGASTDVIIPKTISGTGVTAIGEHAFSGCGIKSVTLPLCIKVIADNAFTNSGLEELYYEGTTNDWGKISVGVGAIPENVNIHINIGISEISLDKTKIYTFINKTEKLTATVAPDTAYNKKILWTSSDESVASVEDGHITPHSLGETIITATAEDGGYTASCTVFVCTDPSLFSFADGVIYRCSGTDSTVIIPDKINDIPVKKIGNSAFSDCAGLTSVIIPDGVTSIGDYAFSNCSKLKEVHISDIAAWCNISFADFNSNPLSNSADLYLNGELVKDLTIPDGVTSIGDYAFCNCSSIESVAMPNSVTSIGSSAFYGCYSLASVTIPDGITSIGRYAFYCCDSLKTITIPDSVTSIGERAFSYCSSLASVTIPNSVTSIGERAFYGCDGLTEISVGENNAFYSSQNGVLFNKKKTTLIQYPARRPNSAYIIPDGVTSICGRAFSGCCRLENLTIPDSITIIGEWALYGCKSLTSVAIPKSVICIGAYAFYDCDSLSEVHTPDIAAWCGIQFDGYRSNPLSYAGHLYAGDRLVTDLVIPEGMTSIDGIFSGIQGVKSITIPKSLQNINYDDLSRIEFDAIYIFDMAAWCNMNIYSSSYSNPTLRTKNLYLNYNIVTDLVIPNGVSVLRNDAFYGNKNITSVTFSNSVAGIGSRAFYGCSNLKNIKLGSGIKDISGDAFRECSNIENIILDANNRDYILSDGVLYNRAKTELVLYPAGSTKTNHNIPSTVAKIGDYAFAACRNLESITIPSSVANIGENAFYNCSNLKEIHIPDIATWCNISFGSSASNPLYYAKNLYLNNELVKDLIIPDGVESIAGKAFYNCGSITSVTIPSSVRTIDEWAFCGCGNMTDMTILNGVTGIGNFAFSGCNSLAGITIPDSVTAIGDSAFSGCDKLTCVTIPDSVEKIGYHTFDCCISLSEISVGANNENYSSQSGVLFNKEKTTLIKYPEGRADTVYRVPDGVTNIGNFAFDSCRGVTNIVIPDSVTKIEDFAFDDCSSLTEITVGDNNEKYSSQNGVLFNKKKTLLIKYPEGRADTVYRVPDGVTNIGNYAFDSCRGVTSIVIPDSVTNIEYYAFCYCKNLKSVTIPNSITSIGANALLGTSLSDVYYQGSEQEWNNIDFTSGNEKLTEARVHFSGQTDYRIGDVNGDGKVTFVDKIYLDRYLAGQKGYDESTIDLLAADVNLDGIVDELDSKILEKHLTGCIGYETLPYLGGREAPVKAEITECSYINNTLSATVEFTSCLTDCRAILAIYDNDGRLSAIVTQTVLNGETKATLKITSEKNLLGKKVKMLFWESFGAMEPVGNVLNSVVTQ